MANSVPIPMTYGNTSLQEKRNELEKQSNDILAQMAKLKDEYNSVTKQLQDYDSALKWKKDAWDLIDVQDGVEYLIIGNWGNLEKDTWYIWMKDWDNIYIKDYNNPDNAFAVSWTLYPENNRDREHLNDVAFNNLVKTTATNVYKRQHKVDDILDEAEENWGWITKREASKLDRKRKWQAKPAKDILENQIVTQLQYNDIINQARRKLRDKL